MLKYGGPSVPTKNKNVIQESYILITTKQTVNLAPPDLHACRKNGGIYIAHIAQSKHDFQNILGCVRLSDLVKTADVFEKFIKICLNYYGLDTCHYFSSPGLSWNEMLKMTGIKLELISDVDMHLFIEKGMRGGISYISKRHNKVDGDDKFIMYWDANNLYGWAMNQPLPY